MKKRVAGDDTILGSVSPVSVDPMRTTASIPVSFSTLGGAPALKALKVPKKLIMKIHSVNYLAEDLRVVLCKPIDIESIMTFAIFNRFSSSLFWA